MNFEEFTSIPGHFVPEKEGPLPLNRSLCGSQGRSGRLEKIKTYCPCRDWIPGPASPCPSHYTDYAKSAAAVLPHKNNKCSASHCTSTPFCHSSYVASNVDLLDCCSNTQRTQLKLGLPRSCILTNMHPIDLF